MLTAANPAEWTIIEQINRTDSTKSWTSPTPVDLNKMVWVYDLEITKLTGTVNVPIIGDITLDVTSSIPADQRATSGEMRNLPAVLLQDMLVHADSGTSADVFVQIDALGFGQAEFSNIVLGSMDVPVFGSRPIQRINVEASVSITGYDPGDYNRDASIDAADYVLWRKTFLQTGPGLAADGNNSEVVDLVDYDIWQEHFGQLADIGSAPTTVPEPTTPLVLILLFAGGLRRHRS
jgi:hypothetical protein